MKKNLIIILCLAIFSLACLETSSAALDVQPIATTWPTLTNVPTAPAALISIATATDSHVEQCAVVVAIDALHLRGGASENADVLTWLKNGDVVQVLSDSDPNWWRVSFGDVEGFARSSFLINAECVK